MRCELSRSSWRVPAHRLRRWRRRAAGQPHQRAVAGELTATVPRFGDPDPHDWDGVVPWQYQVHGVDVSKYQGDIDWPRVRSSGVAFAYIKATEGGDHADERFLDNWEGAHARRRAARRLPLLLLLPHRRLEQAAWFIDHVPRDPSALPPVLDLEWTHKSRTCT